MAEKMKMLIKIQRAIRSKYWRIQFKRSKLIHYKMKEATTKFKTKIRFQLESDAADVISQVYHKQVFRDKLF